MMNQELPDILQLQSEMYRLLSNIYIRVPDAAFVDALRGQILHFLLSVRSVARKGKWPKGIAEGIDLIERYINVIEGEDSKDVAEKLAVEFTRLFRGVKKGYGPPPPYESVYRGSGQVMGDVTSAVQEKYVGAGLKVVDSFGGEPPDHIGLELYFLSHLCEREAESPEGSDMAAEYRKKKEEFLREHLLRWVGRFSDRIERESGGFYGSVVKLTRAFVEFDHKVPSA